jgi:hypothetical protein
MISGFRRDVGETCGLLGYYAAFSVIFVPTFRDNLSFLSSKAKKSKKVSKNVLAELVKYLIIDRFVVLTSSTYSQQVSRLFIFT